MRKLQLILLIALLKMFCISADAEFFLPASLVVIDDEAFIGTAADAVFLQDAVEVIGDYSFAQMPSLRSVVVPESVTVIGDHAFTSVGTKICGTPGSYAETWALTHSFQFVNVAVPAEDGEDLHGAASMLLVGVLFALAPPIPDCCDPKNRIVNIKIKALCRFSELYPVLYDFP